MKPSSSRLSAIAGISLAVAIATTACSTTAIGTAPSDHKALSVAVLKSFETAGGTALDALHPSRYTQHNPNVPDGPAAVKGFIQALPKGSVRVQTVRTFQDGDYVFLHSEYELYGPKIAFDIFRFDGDKIVEHWDNLQDKAAAPNPSGHTMIDGASVVQDLDKTTANKELVRTFVDDILLHGRMNRFAGYFDGDNYLQHNPLVADKVSGLGAALQEFAKKGLTIKYDRIHAVLGEGNFVLVVSEGSFAGKPTTYYDLFRVQGGKIAEHWDVLEDIPPRERWKNPNGKFGF